MPLAAFLLLLRSFGLPHRGRQVMAKLLVRCSPRKGMPFKAAAYWYSVVKFPTSRRKAYLHDKEIHPLFLLIKVGILENNTYLYRSVSDNLQNQQYTDKIPIKKDTQRLPFLRASFMCLKEVPLLTSSIFTLSKQLYVLINCHRFNPKIHLYI